MENQIKLKDIKGKKVFLHVNTGKWSTSEEVLQSKLAKNKVNDYEAFKKNYGEASPYLAYIELTNKCNLKCSYCYNNFCVENHKFLSVDEFKLLVKQLKDNNINMVTLSGGEPLLHKNIVEFIKILNENNIKISIITNGTLLSREILEAISGINVQINISLDSGNEECNDLLRGKSVYKKVINALELLREYKLINDVKILCTLVSQSIKDIEALIDLCISYGIREVEFTIGQVNGRLAENLDCISKEFSCLLKYLVDKKMQLQEEITITGASISTPINALIFGGSKINFGCSMCNVIKIDINGDVYPCPFISSKEYILGKLSEDNLDLIIKGKEIKSCKEKFIDKIYSIKCVDCTWKMMCGGGCTAESICGNELSCELNKEMYEYCLGKLI